MTSFDQRAEPQLSRAQLDAVDRSAAAQGMKPSECLRFHEHLGLAIVLQSAESQKIPNA